MAAMNSLCLLVYSWVCECWVPNSLKPVWRLGPKGVQTSTDFGTQTFTQASEKVKVKKLVLHLISSSLLFIWCLVLGFTSLGRIQFWSNRNWSFLQDYWAITASMLGANLSTAHKLEGWKAWVGLEVAPLEIESGSLALELETPTTKPCNPPSVDQSTQAIRGCDKQLPWTSKARSAIRF